MVDTFRPLELGEGGLAVDDGLYAMSWSKGAGRSATAGARTPRADRVPGPSAAAPRGESSQTLDRGNPRARDPR